MKQIESDDSVNIFSNLSSDTRLEILRKLQNNSLKISHLAIKMNTTIQALQRHIDILTRSGMIQREGDGSLSISSVGMASLEQIPTFSFLMQHRNYFMDHNFDGVPKTLIHRIGELNNTKFAKNTMETWQRAKVFAENAKEYFWGMSSMTPMEFFDIAMGKTRAGVKYRLVFPQNMIVPKGFEKKRKSMGWYQAIKEKKVEEHYVKNLAVTVTISENGANLIFAHKNTGQIDGNTLFYSNDKSFQHWCIDLFEHYWNNVPQVKTVKFNEV